VFRTKKASKAEPPSMKKIADEILAMVASAVYLSLKE
jgi:hypothetical protein